MDGWMDGWMDGLMFNDALVQKIYQLLGINQKVFFMFVDNVLFLPVLHNWLNKGC